MKVTKLEELETASLPVTALVYCPAGGGKTSLAGLAAQVYEKRTLFLDVDRTVPRSLGKLDVVPSVEHIDVTEIDNHSTWESWTETLRELDEMAKSGALTKIYDLIVVDNISELERCILADFGRQGKNKGVPDQAAYQYMQFKLINSLRLMKRWGVNIIWTAWEELEAVSNADGSQYTRAVPKVNKKIRDNVCGLCDVVGRIFTNADGVHGVRLESSMNAYAKNQVDSRRGCRVEDFAKWHSKEKKEEQEEQKND